MKKRGLLILILWTTVACVAIGQRRLNVRDHETIRRTLDFANGATTRVLDVDNVQGSIRVTGYDGSTVEMIADKTIRAESQDRLSQAQHEVRLDIQDKQDTISVFVDQPGHERSTNSSSHSNWSDRGYEVSFNYEFRVPRQIAVRLRTINDGDIRVEDINGDFDVNNINGGIEMSSMSGSGRAHTINGGVRVTFRNNPRNDSHFGSLNGNIEVTFPQSLSADVRFKTFNGGVYTDFPVTGVPVTLNASQRRDGRLVYKNEYQLARIGNGGPTLEFDGFNGDVRILQTK
jgi:hypothetical protein